MVFHETYYQLYPAAETALATEVRDKTLLGFHDVRIGNAPDQRLIRFIHDTLPRLLPEARARFERYFDLLERYGNREIGWPECAGRILRRERGEPEDGAAADWLDNFEAQW